MISNMGLITGHFIFLSIRLQNTSISHKRYMISNSLSVFSIGKIQKAQSFKFLIENYIQSVYYPNNAVKKMRNNKN